MARVWETFSERTSGSAQNRVRLLQKRLCFALLLLLGAAIAAKGLGAQQPGPSEYKIKATYLYNFGRFVKWPEDLSSGKTDSFGVCVLGQDPFGPTLDSTFAGETLDGKPVVVKRVARAQGALGCRILFISSTEEAHLKAILAVLDDAGTLTVSDMPEFTERGGMIQFVFEGSKIRFEVNLASAESSRLVLSSELLKVASTVKGSVRPGE
jgi:YfiR/HmsC-like